MVDLWLIPGGRLLKAQAHATLTAITLSLETFSSAWGTSSRYSGALKPGCHAAHAMDGLGPVLHLKPSESSSGSRRCTSWLCARWVAVHFFPGMLHVRPGTLDRGVGPPHLDPVGLCRGAVAALKGTATARSAYYAAWVRRRDLADSLCSPRQDIADRSGWLPSVAATRSS